MIEDSALTLKKLCENGEDISIEKAKELLNKSELIGKLLTNPKQKCNTFVGLRAYEWRLLELCEIPYTYTFEKVQEWLELLIDKSFIQEGFSLTGDKDGLLACHNAIITTILIKMNCNDKNKIDAGINWILDYQNVERGKQCNWTGKDLLTKYGGCMKKTPCFYGVVKSMAALTEYRNRFGNSEKIDDKLNQGLEYILKHNVYKKLSTGNPIEPSIITNFYPYTYKSNIIEILSLLKKNGLLGDARCKNAVDILKQKQRNDGSWQADTTYMKTAWIEFDKPKKSGQWISYVVSKLINN